MKDSLYAAERACVTYVSHFSVDLNSQERTIIRYRVFRIYEPRTGQHSSTILNDRESILWEKKRERERKKNVSSLYFFLCLRRSEWCNIVWNRSTRNWNEVQKAASVGQREDIPALLPFPRESFQVAGADYFTSAGWLLSRKLRTIETSTPPRLRRKEGSSNKIPPCASVFFLIVSTKTVRAKRHIFDGRTIGTYIHTYIQILKKIITDEKNAVHKLIDRWTRVELTDNRFDERRIRFVWIRLCELSRNSCTDLTKPVDHTVGWPVRSDARYMSHR